MAPTQTGLDFSDLIVGTWQWLKERSGRADFKGLVCQAFGPATASKAWDQKLSGVLGVLASGKGLSGLRFELVDGQTLSLIHI